MSANQTRKKIRLIKKYFISISFVVSVIFAIIGIVLSYFIIRNDAYFNTSCIIDTKLASDFGEFFGGFVGTIFSIASVYLLIYSITHQKEENIKNDIKNNFFKILDYHNDNVKNIRLGSCTTKEKLYGRQAISNVFWKNIKKIWEIVKEINKDQSYKLKEEELIPLVFELTYSGLTSDNGETANEIKNKLESEYNFIGDFIKNICKKGKELKNGENLKDGEQKGNYFRGYRSTFSSYFRNIYGAIKFLYEDIHLSKEEKYDLMQILRMQLSYAEQSLIGWYFLSWQVQDKDLKKIKEFVKKCNLLDDIPERYFGELFKIKEELFK